MAKVKEAEKQTKQDIQKAQPTQALSPFEEMDRLFDTYFSRGWLSPFRWTTPKWSETTAPFEGKMPNVDVIDRDKEIVVKAELPGVDKKDIDISVTKDAVTIKGTTSHEEKEEKGDYYRCEISHGSYSRTVALPANVDEEKAKAKFKDGILEISIPKTGEAKRKTIKID